MSSGNKATSSGASTAAMAIEQMFEDIPTTTYSSIGGMTTQRGAALGHARQQQGSGPAHKVTRPAPRSRHKVVKSGSEVQPQRPSGVFKTLDVPAGQSKSNNHHHRGGSTASNRLPRKVVASTASLQTTGSVASGSRSVEEAGAKRGSRRSASINQLDRMTPTTALAMFGSKLTSYERNEIKEYSNIYFMGLAAKKIGASTVKADPSLYDDEENFYKIVPHDQVVYRFEITEKPNLGKGTFGQVIKAYDHKERQHVALKFVRNERIYLKQSREELRILQVLRKQDPNGFYNVVLMKEFFMFRNHMIIAFELLGMNLYQVLSKNGNRGLPMVRILPIARGIIKCLELLFKNRIIHCDLKPENIMLRRNGDLGSIKVGDFGSSCYEQQQVYHYIQSRYYRAPEVILGMRYGPAIDMWSLGCVLGELSTGSPLFQGSNESDQLAAIEEMMGEMPKNMLSKSTKFKEGAGGAKSVRRGGPGTKQLTTELGGDDHFKDLIGKTLTLDPNLRPTPTELQEHSWLSKNRSTTRIKPVVAKT